MVPPPVREGKSAARGCHCRWLRTANDGWDDCILCLETGDEAARHFPLHFLFPSTPFSLVRVRGLCEPDW